MRNDKPYCTACIEDGPSQARLQGISCAIEALFERTLIIFTLSFSFFLFPILLLVFPLLLFHHLLPILLHYDPLRLDALSGTNLPPFCTASNLESHFFATKGSDYVFSGRLKGRKRDLNAVYSDPWWR